MQCEKLKTCPFYNKEMPIDQGLGALYYKKYCEGDKSLCARYKVATTIGPQAVTINLYPNMMAQAEKIIEDHTEK